jgi:hypothetical protein
MHPKSMPKDTPRVSRSDLSHSRLIQPHKTQRPQNFRAPSFDGRILHTHEHQGLYFSGGSSNRMSVADHKSEPFALKILQLLVSVTRDGLLPVSRTPAPRIVNQAPARAEMRVRTLTLQIFAANAVFCSDDSSCDALHARL